MKIFNRHLVGLILALSCATNSSFAANHTTDLSGWGYTEIRQSSLLPVLVPLGIAAIMMTAAYLAEESRGGGHQHHAH